MTQPLLIAHRGDHVNFQENTIDAFASAFEHGADGVEMDVQLYAGNLVINHDFLVGNGSEHGGHATLPKLEEVLGMFAAEGKLQLDFKMFDAEFIPPLKRLLDQYGSDDIELISNIWPIIPALRHGFPDREVGIIFPEREFESWMGEELIRAKVTRLMSTMKGDVAHLPPAIIDADHSLVEACQDEGIKIHSHIDELGQDEEMRLYRLMSALGVEQCSFSDARRIRSIRQLDASI
jgi:hypothetical protein